MTTVEEHRAVVASLLAPMPAEEVALYDARARVLAGDVVAATALPSFDNSAMDGYAVRAAEVAGAPVALPWRSTSPPVAPTSRRSRRAPSRGS